VQMEAGLIKQITVRVSAEFMRRILLE